MWFTETAWPPIIAAVSLGLVFGMLWLDRQQSRYLAAIGLCLVFGGGAWLVDRAVVTERERVEQSLADLANAFQQRDTAGVEDAISARAPDLQKLAATALTAVTVTSLRLTDVNSELSSEDTRALVHFRVNGTVQLNTGRPLGHKATRWIGRWERDTDRWRMVDIEQLDIITGEVIWEARRYLGQ